MCTLELYKLNRSTSSLTITHTIFFMETRKENNPNFFSHLILIFKKNWFRFQYRWRPSQAPTPRLPPSGKLQKNESLFYTNILVQRRRVTNRYYTHLFSMECLNTGFTTARYSLCHTKGTFSVTIVFYFSVHYQSITEYRYGRPTTDGNLLYETCVTMQFIEKPDY